VRVINASPQWLQLTETVGNVGSLTVFSSIQLRIALWSQLILHSQAVY
jgi:hypothetical protein